jgi:hypothetical protein
MALSFQVAYGNTKAQYPRVDVPLGIDSPNLQGFQELTGWKF